MHYLWALKDNGIIDKAVVSFNIASLDMDDKPFALFGGVKGDQIVGGAEAMTSFPSYPNFLGTWALEGQSIHYDGKPIENTARSLPAIIDTGTSQISIPPAQFSHLVETWTGRGVPGTLVRRLLTELERSPSGRWPAPGGVLELRRAHLRFLPVPAPSGRGQASG